MRHFNKGRLLATAKDHITMVREKITALLPEYKRQIQENAKALPRLSPEKQYVAEGVIKNLTQQVHNLDALYPSPYFIKCIVRFDSDVADRIFYFSKLPFAEESIYSWTAPAATLRFSEPGKFSYVGGDKEIITGTLLGKEQYLISDGHIVFMAAESTEVGRELIYQEHFSKRKTEFVLPEIVEQMEAAQDKAIRTPPSRSLLISGPAGSGKTTLALHRVAYLLQSPDTAEKFSAEKTIVFVNDHGTRNYFGSLLPELGITGVTITTFADFVFENLHIRGATYQTAYGQTEYEQNTYAYEKSQILANSTSFAWHTDHWSTLSAIYQPRFSQASSELFAKQHFDKILDRFDVSLLLQTYLYTHKTLTTYETEYTQLSGGKVKRSKKKVKKEYSLVILDEVQNYLPEQLHVLTKILSASGSCVYVGDLAQQTKLFTIRSWEQVGQTFTEDNTVKLEKVYRSTKQILEYIKSQGYSITIPESGRTGKPVHAQEFKTTSERNNYIDNLVSKHAGVTVGILGPQAHTLQKLAQKYKANPQVKVLGISEAQGVEFDVVILCDTETLQTKEQYPADLATQVEQINKDLLYVALTRAMNELYVLRVEQ